MWPYIQKCLGSINNDTLESFFINNLKDSYVVLALKLQVSVYKIINIDI